MAAMDRGVDPGGLVAAARAFYLLARYNPSATSLTVAPLAPAGHGSG